jgi:hypothetical protein
MDETTLVLIVASSLSMGVFTLAGIQLMNMNWFKRENWKFNRDLKKREADLNFKKIARDLGLEKKPSSENTSPQSGSLADNARSLLPLLSRLAPEQIQDLASMFLGGDSEEAPPTSPLSGVDGLLQFAAENPKLVEGFLQGMKKPQNETQSNSLI